MVTLLGSELPALLSASVIVEQVFGLHGIGMMAFDAVMTRDVPLLLGITTVGCRRDAGGCARRRRRLRARRSAAARTQRMSRRTVGR